MSNFNNLRNRRFGRLVAVSIAGRDSSGYVRWKCQCDCGNIHYARSSHLLVGNIHSCGCLTRKDITNQRFGRLVALRSTNERIDRSVVWECLCDCGTICFKTTSNLIKGHVKSCGCLCKDNKARYGFVVNPRLTDVEREERRDLQRNVSFRNQVFKLDDYTCQVCDKRGGRLNAHHLYSYKDFPDMRFNASNGITLCEKCHKSFHGEYGMKHSTDIQFNEFLTG